VTQFSLVDIYKYFGATLRLSVQRRFLCATWGSRLGENGTWICVVRQIFTNFSEKPTDLFLRVGNKGCKFLWRVDTPSYKTTMFRIFYALPMDVALSRTPPFPIQCTLLQRAPF
jgi:hypothetical protein